ncbi:MULTISPECIES: aromatic acid exporter family protein [Paenibacillus]|uniref:aromatic acid exporter family protein n=1 Tax=Paenibacillus TaxID=44249 RepID=UPI0022B93B10|nr:aromatic acid exporter family protein [Paenibacillus caseinilyticus]MCZ8521460.1 aromatic acid exporter family protein [Paenibacillus caseinilyticus]
MGIRVLKTAIAVIAAIYISLAVGLTSPLSSGLLAIMGVDVTIKKGLRTSFQRIAASVIGLFFASGLFWALGFHVWVIGVFVLVLYPVLAQLELRDGIITSSVVMLHVYGTGALSTDLLLNEIALLVIGLGTATVINMLYMPKENKNLQLYRLKVEELFSRIFLEISLHLRNNAYVWSGAELLEAEDTLREAIRTAERTDENSIVSGGPAWTVYFYMRDTQLLAISRMARLVARVYQALPHGELLASVFDELQEDVKVPHYTGRGEKKLEELQEQYRFMPLPQTREEFEIRAALLQLVEELKAYLDVAKREKRPIERDRQGA